MRLAWALMASVVTLAAGAHAVAQSPPSRGDMRITRVTDPVMVCNVMLMGALASAHPRARFNPGRPQVTREANATVVTWQKIEIAGVGDRQTAVCRAEATQITSLALAGVETLTQPQPY